ncbi:hypothetical protein VUR80DRAFT_3500 [Thermomyces stellatus]
MAVSTVVLHGPSSLEELVASRGQDEGDTRVIYSRNSGAGKQDKRRRPTVRNGLGGVLQDSGDPRGLSGYIW